MIVWNEHKRLANLTKHGLDFEDCHLVYNSSNKISLCTTRGEEVGFMDIAMVERVGAPLVLVYAERGENVLAISFRRASRQERRLYAEVIGDQPD